MTVLTFKKRPTSVQAALKQFENLQVDTILVIGRTPDKELHWSMGGQGTISEAVGLLAVLQYEIMREADGPG